MNSKVSRMMICTGQEWFLSAGNIAFFLKKVRYQRQNAGFSVRLAKVWGLSAVLE
jgi:hypothetical protein